MNTHRLINWLLAAVIAAGMSTAYLLDAPSEIQSMRDSAQTHIDAEQAAQKQERFAKAAQAMCGQQAGWQLVDDNTVQCLTHKGRKTSVRKVEL